MKIRKCRYFGTRHLVVILESSMLKQEHSDRGHHDVLQLAQHIQYVLPQLNTSGPNSGDRS
jgi:hypothetical protein